MRSSAGTRWGPLALREGPGPGGQEGEAALEARQDLLGRQDLRPGGRQLDGSRQLDELLELGLGG